MSALPKTLHVGYSDGSGETALVVRGEAADRRVADTRPGCGCCAADPADEHRELATEIALRWNAHEDLLAALEEQVAEFDKRLREYVNGGDDAIAAIAMQHHGDRMDRARAAIAKARGAA